MPQATRTTHYDVVVVGSGFGGSVTALRLSEKGYRVGVLETGAWRRHAGQANAMAKRLEAGLRRVDGIRILYPVQANAVFAELPPAVAARAAARVPFHVWDTAYSATGVEVRLVTSFDTTDDDVDGLAAVLAEELAREAVRA